MIDGKLEKEIKNLKENFDGIYARQKARRERNIKEHPEIARKTNLSLDLAFQMHKARRRAKLTQVEVAEMLNTKQASLSRMEKGGNFKLDTLQRYAEVCGCRLSVKMVPKRSAARRSGAKKGHNAQGLALAH